MTQDKNSLLEQIAQCFRQLVSDMSGHSIGSSYEVQSFDSYAMDGVDGMEIPAGDELNTQPDLAEMAEAIAEPILLAELWDEPLPAEKVLLAARQLEGFSEYAGVDVSNLIELLRLYAK